MRIRLSIFFLFSLTLMITQASAQNRPGNGKWWQVRDKFHPKSDSAKEQASEGPVITVEEVRLSIEQLASDLLTNIKEDWKTCYSVEATLPKNLEEAYDSLTLIADLTNHQSKVQPSSADCSQTSACEMQKNPKIGCFTKNDDTVKIINDIKLEKKYSKKKHRQLKSLIDLLESHKGL